jgi:hypothetical protein
MEMERGFRVGILNENETEEDARAYTTAVALAALSAGLSPQQVRAASDFAAAYSSTNRYALKELARSHAELGLSSAKTAEIASRLVLGECRNNPESPAHNL